jgi:hypothetical protein
LSAIAQFAREELRLELTPMQARAVSEFEDGHQQAVLRVGRRGGKQICVKTPIPTPSGWTTMGDLRPGDMVFDERGHQCVVLACAEVQERPMFRVCFSDDSEILADADHLWTTLDHTVRKALSRYGQAIPIDWPWFKSPGKPAGSRAGEGDRACSYPGCGKVVRARGYCPGHYCQAKAGRTLVEVQHGQASATTLTTAAIAETIGYGKRGDINHSIPATQPLWGPEMLLPVDLYVLGAWLGDGTAISSGFTNIDPDVIDEIRRAGYTVTQSPSQVPKEWTINGLSKGLRQLGVLGDKHIPPICLRASVAQRIALLQGLMDTDGYANFSKGACEFTTTRWRLAEGVYELATSLGLVVHVYRGGATIDGRLIGPKWRITFNPWFVPFRLPRKVARVRERLDGPRQGLRKLRYITAVEPAGVGQMRCITVSSPSGLYLAGRAMIPTHNSLLADVIALYDALVRDYLREKMLLGEHRITSLLCPRLDQAQAHIVNISALLQRAPQLRSMVSAQIADEIQFRNGSVIRAFPCSARGIRGGAWSACIMDELGHFMTSDEGNAAGDRVLEAALPSLAQFGDDGWLICISTPLWKQGAFWKLCQRAESGNYPYIYSLHASTAEMNPNIPKSWLEQRRIEDPDLYRREFLAEFVDGSSAFLNSVDVLACQRKGIGTLAPRDGFSYVGTIDPAFSRDLFAMAIGHRENDQLVMDGVWTWHREGFEATLDQVVQVAERYRVRSLRTDQFSAQAVMEGLGKRGLHCEAVPWDSTGKWQAYARMKALINTRELELPDDEKLAAELMGLEARTTPAGAIRIAAGGGGHDDRASVLAALVDSLEGPRASAEALWSVWAAYEPEQARTYKEDRADPLVW